MSFTAALYEGDSVIHRTAAMTRVARSATPLESAELATAEFKGWGVVLDAVWGAIKSAVLWIEEKSRQAHYRRLDAYLSQSTDHADLERRIRDLERRNQLNWIDCASR